MHLRMTFLAEATNPGNIDVAGYIIVKALCHDIRLDCFVIASLVAKFN